jgi:magnesium chelatase subunit D
MGGVTAAPESPWQVAALAAAVFAVDPAGLCGIVVKTRPGPVRDAWLERALALLPKSAPARRMPVNVADGRLLGGLDLAATLAAGRPVAERGILADVDGGVLIVPMAERLEPATAARLGAILDTGSLQVERDGIGLTVESRFGVIAFDEGIDDERPDPALVDRLALAIDLDLLAPRDIVAEAMTRESIAAARERLPLVQADASVLRALCAAALALGVASMRASILAVRAARAIAALNGRDGVEPEDAALAAQLVLAPRATMLPLSEETEMEPPAESTAEPDDADPTNPPVPPDMRAEQDRPVEDTDGTGRPLDDIVLAAAAAAMPAGMLAKLRAEGRDRRRSRTFGKAGTLRAAIRHGRPVGVRNGALTDGVRLNLLETLRAAAPWQRLRREAAGRNPGDALRIEVRKDDFRLPRLKQRAATTTIFVVDASGSSALNRLAEAKGAVELLLAECYVRRDKVALVAFRGTGADLLLPPTRSLVRAKRCLADLPGGGGTPLADGIDAAAALADSARRQGSTPVVILMTDGRANVARGGVQGRSRAESDAHAAARALRAADLSVLLVDTSPRRQPVAAQFAAEMGATYLPLPPGGASALARGIQAATGRPERRAS